MSSAFAIPTKLRYAIFRNAKGVMVESIPFYNAEIIYRQWLDAKRALPLAKRLGWRGTELTLEDDYALIVYLNMYADHVVSQNSVIFPISVELILMMK